jgi:hypothetical protein
MRKQLLIYVPLVAKCLPKIRQSPIHGSGRMTRYPEIESRLALPSGHSPASDESLRARMTLRQRLISGVPRTSTGRGRNAVKWIA